MSVNILNKTSNADTPYTAANKKLPQNLSQMSTPQMSAVRREQAIGCSQEVKCPSFNHNSVEKSCCLDWEHGESFLLPDDPKWPHLHMTGTSGTRICVTAPTNTQDCKWDHWRAQQANICSDRSQPPEGHTRYWACELEHSPLGLSCCAIRASLSRIWFKLVHLLLKCVYITCITFCAPLL